VAEVLPGGTGTVIPVAEMISALRGSVVIAAAA